MLQPKTYPRFDMVVVCLTMCINPGVYDAQHNLQAFNDIGVHEINSRMQCIKRRASGVFTSPSHRAYFTHLCRKLHDSTYLIRLFQLKHLPLCLAYSRLPGNVLFILICCEKGLRKKTEEICPLTSDFLKSLFYYFPYR